MKTMNNETIKRLLKVNRKALRTLHNVIGFDFEKPFACIALNGNFTIKKVYNTIDNAGLDTDNAVIALLVRNPDGRYPNELRLAGLKNGSVQIEYRFIGGLGTFYRKIDFEDARKARRAETFIIVQSAEHINVAQEKPFDLNARYKDAPHHNLYRGRYYGSGDFTIDKSGYILDERRSDLKRRANALRAEREKQLYLQTDNTGKVEELRKLIEDRKMEIVQELIAAKSYEDIEAVNKKLGYFNGLEGTMRNFERYARRTTERDYSTIEESESAYMQIKKSLGAC